MKNAMLKIMLALGITASLAAVSTQAQAGGCCYKKPTCYNRCYQTTLAFHGCGYQSYMKRSCCNLSGGYYQGRPVNVINGDAYYVRHCTSGYWYHHKWHRPYCS